MASKIIHPVLLCGGGGTRLWPLSTKLEPKQFLALTGARTMLEATYDRFAGRDGFSNPIGVGSLRHEDLLKHALPDSRLILEPFGRNSAPAIAAAALIEPEPVLQLALPADHHIKNLEAFHTAITLAAEAAEAGQIVTFGITPDHPATGYGYIESGDSDGQIRSVARFVEKPDRQTAEDYIATGRYFWNAGIFLYRSDVMLAALNAHAPAIVAGVKAALPERNPAMALNAAAFAKCPSDSIDYAVMEHADNISVVPVDMGWSDLGDHRAIYELNAPEGGTLISGPGVVTHGTDNFIRSTGPQIAVHGADHLTVIATRDSVLVTPTKDAAGIKPAVETILSGKARTDQISPDRRARIKTWLSEDILPHWLENAWDEPTGSFVESLTLSGDSEPERERRGRVCPRQIYSFAAASRLGFDPDGRASDLVLKGLQYLNTTARAPLGGWAHKLGANGRPIDTRRDFYDHAFVALASAEAYAATGETLALEIAEEAFALIDQLFSAPDGRGWRDTETGDPGGRASNPHMHLLEASLAMFAVTGDPAALERSQTIVTLLEADMFDYELGAVQENFDARWVATTDPQSARIEPGHCYEWAYLLGELDSQSGRDTRSWSNRLIRFAEEAGVAQSGLTYNAVSASKSVQDPNHRLWPQLERLRAKLFNPVMTRPGEIDQLSDKIFELYLSKGPKGGWVDAIDHQGEPTSQHVPASMVYHLITAFGWALAD